MRHIAVHVDLGPAGVRWCKPQVAQAKKHKAPDTDERAELDTAVDGLHGDVDIAGVAGLDRVGADDTADDADGTDQQGEDDALVAKRSVAEDHSGDDGDFV